MNIVQTRSLNEREPNIFTKLESNVQSYARTFPCLLRTASGSRVETEDGSVYLDFLAGCGSLNYGHNNPILKQALIAHILEDGLAHSLDLHTTAKQEFLEAFQEIILLPRRMDYVVQFTGPTGANAVEAALKIARKVTGRTNVICFTNGFHGVTFGALAATGSKFHRGGAGLPLAGAVTMPYDGYLGAEFDTIAYLEKMLNDPSSGIDEPAAVIVETVQGEGGLHAASADWLRKLEQLCRRRDILLIVDDIQAGCGRTGSFFSFEDAGIVPDIVTLAKSLSGFGLPFAATLLRPGLDVWQPGEHNGTFRGNNHAFVTAAEALKAYWRNDELANAVKAKGAVLERRLHELLERFPRQLAEVRGRGMMRGLSFSDPDSARGVTERAFGQGLIIERSGPFDEVVKFLMPLTIEMEDLNAGVDIIEHAITEEFAVPQKLV